jgi:hypothetical protein
MAVGTTTAFKYDQADLNFTFFGLVCILVFCAAVVLVAVAAAAGTAAAAVIVGGVAFLVIGCET